MTGVPLLVALLAQTPPPVDVPYVALAPVWKTGDYWTYSEAGVFGRYERTIRVKTSRQDGPYNLMLVSFRVAGTEDEKYLRQDRESRDIYIDKGREGKNWALYYPGNLRLGSIFSLYTGDRGKVAEGKWIVVFRDKAIEVSKVTLTARERTTSEFWNWSYGNVFFSETESKDNRGVKHTVKSQLIDSNYMVKL